MNGKKILLVTITFLILAGLSNVYIRPARAAPVYLVNLDANSIGQTKFIVTPTATQTHGFRVGAIINATSTAPLANVQGFQFTIHYNASAFVPQGDPSSAAVPGNPSALYVDGATNTVLFGANPNIVNPAGVMENWAALLASGAAFRVVTVSVAGSTGALTVAYSILGANSQVSINGPNLLANVAFELVNKPSTLQTFTISDVIFVNNAGASISSVSAGAAATETVNDAPPTARFTTAHLAPGSAACTPVTGVACTAYAYQFDASTSTDETPLSTAAGTAGFFWDFGDQQQDGFYPGSTFTPPVSCTNANLATFTCQGAVAIHDYGVANPLTGAVPAPGKFNVTLRVQDAQLDTGAARNSLGAPYLTATTPPASCSSPECSSNTQPSHSQQLNLLADIPPTASFTPTSTTCTSPCTVTFNAAASAPGQTGTTISKYTWNFGDGNTTSVGASAIFHKYTATATTTFNVVLTVTDNLGATGQATGSVIVSTGAAKPVVTITSLSPSPGVIGQPVTVTFTATNSPTSVTANWGDGSPVVSLAGTATTDTHTYTVSGSFTVTVSATNTAGTGSATMSETVNKRTTSTVVVCGATVAIAQSVSCTATVTDTNGVGASAPTGTVGLSYSAGLTGPAGCGLTAGTASSTCTFSATGASAAAAATVSGTFVATAVHDTSSGTSGGVAVTLRTASTGVVCNPANPAAGTSTSCTATVSDTGAGASAPGGTVLFSGPTGGGSFTAPNPCTLVTVAGTTTSSCSVTYTPSVSGAQTITAVYTPNDSVHSTSQGTFPISGGVPPPVVTITSLSPSPGVVGQPVTVIFTATDSPTSVTVSWGDGTVANLAGTATTDTHTYSSSGTFTVTVSATNSGGTGSAPPAQETVNKRTTSTVVSCGPASVAISQPISCTASVSDTNGAGGSTPTGSVTFTTPAAGSFSTPNPCTLSATGSCSVTFTPSSTGSVSFTGTYSPATGSVHDTSTGTSTPATTVTLRTTTTTVSCSPSNPTVGQATSCAATVADTNGAGASAPAGTVLFSGPAGGGSFTAPNPCTLVTVGSTTSCSVSYTPSVSGAQTITAVYTPNDSVHSTSQGTFPISGGVPPPVVTITSANPNPGVIGQPVTVTFTATNSPTSVTADWGDGSPVVSLAGTATTDTHIYTSSGSFTVTVSAANGGGTGSANLPESVNKRTTSITVSCTPISVPVGQPSTCAATVADTTGAVGATTPAGSVSFTSSGGAGIFSTPASCTLSVAGTCTVTFSPSSTTPSTISGTYTPSDTVHAASSSSGAQNGSVTGVQVVGVPVVTVNAPSPNPANEGVTVSVTWTVSSSATVIASCINWGDRASVCGIVGTTSATHIYNVGSSTSQTFTITVNATNSAGIGQGTNTVMITDLAPTVTITSVSPNPATPAQPVTLSFTATDDEAISNTCINWGDGSSACGITSPVTHAYTASVSTTFTISVNATDAAGKTGSNTASETIQSIAPPTAVVLTFQAFNMDDFENGVGQLQVFINGHLVVDIPAGLNHLTGSGDYTPYTDRWVSFGPFDITSFVVQGQNTIVFMDPLSSHFGLVRNVTIIQGNTTLLRVRGAAHVSPEHSVTFTFSIPSQKTLPLPPLVVTSFDATTLTPQADQIVTFTVTYAGGTRPVSCSFAFGDGESAAVQGIDGMCTVTHDYDSEGSFTATVTVVGSSTSDLVSTSIDLSVSEGD